MGLVTGGRAAPANRVLFDMSDHQPAVRRAAAALPAPGHQWALATSHRGTAFVCLLRCTTSGYAARSRVCVAPAAGLTGSLRPHGMRGSSQLLYESRYEFVAPIMFLAFLIEDEKAYFRLLQR